MKKCEMIELSKENKNLNRLACLFNELSRMSTKINRLNTDNKIDGTPEAEVINELIQKFTFVMLSELSEYANFIYRVRELVKNKDFIELKKFVNNHYVVDTPPRDFNE